MVEHDSEGLLVSKLYDLIMLIIIIISIIPLAFRETNTLFTCFEIVSVTIFIIDYLLRWLTADYKLKKRQKVEIVSALSIYNFCHYRLTIDIAVVRIV